MKNFIEFWEFIQPALGDDFYRYTYLKEVVRKTNIGKEGISLPVKYDVINNKAGFWFNMNEEPIENNVGKLEVSAYNDDIKYTLLNNRLVSIEDKYNGQNISYSYDNNNVSIIK